MEVKTQLHVPGTFIQEKYASGRSGEEEIWVPLLESDLSCSDRTVVLATVFSCLADCFR